MESKRLLLFSGLLIAAGVSACFVSCSESVDPVEAFMSAAAQADSAQLQTLLQASDTPEINTRDWQGRTALFHAARHGQVKNLRLLLEAGADINCADNGGLTPLYAAAWFGYSDCVELLLQCPGINAAAVTLSGETAYSAAVQNEHEACANLLRPTLREAALAELKKRCPDFINSLDVLIDTSLEKDDAEMMQLLLEAKLIAPNACDETGRTLLDRAIENGSEACTEVLLNAE